MHIPRLKWIEIHRYGFVRCVHVEKHLSRIQGNYDDEYLHIAQKLWAD